MNKLEVIFRLGLAHPLLIMDSLNRSPTTRFPDTGNRVWVEVLAGASWLENATDRGVFDVLLVHVERECKAEDRDAARYYAKLEEWGTIRDAATTLWRVLEYIREEDFLRTGTVSGYPAVPSESPQSNPIVQAARAEVIFDGEALTTMPLSGIPSIQITYGVWDRICERLERGEQVPSYRNFLLDAYYFGTSGDPIRAVIMACASWETALRQFLSSVAAKYPANADLPKLRTLAEHAKGAVLFDGEDGDMKKRLTEQIAKLARLRNKLLHEGKKDLAKEDVVGMTLAVDAAIEWLFR